MLKIGLVGPEEGRRCGIGDYAHYLKGALENVCRLTCCSYAEAFTHPALSGCSGILLNYEASLVPSSEYMKRIGAMYPGKVFVIPHEVHKEDPFAFPYKSLKSRVDLLLKLKQLLYKVRHRAYEREKFLQRSGYFAYKTIPLSYNNREILRDAGALNLMEPVPLAFFPPAQACASDGEGANQVLGQWLNPPFSRVLGLFGFLNPANDYELVFEALKKLPKDVRLLFIGGERRGVRVSSLQALASAGGLADRTGFTGFLPEDGLEKVLSCCKAFICPFKFKSNCSSVLRLITLGKPVIASAIPALEEAAAMGAPLELYHNTSELEEFLTSAVSGTLIPRENRYFYDFKSVADMYLERIRSAAVS